jgi:uncharacterized membrane protein YebE (DUF533 family)
MFDARELLGKLMQSDMTGATRGRIDHAVGPQGLGAGGNPLAGLFGQGGVGGGLAGRAGELFGTARNRVESGDPLAMGGLGALAGLVLGGRGGALGGGALALLGSLAYSALKKSQGAAQPVPAETLAVEAPVGLREPQTPAEEQQCQQTALLAIRAMIAAAKADGQIDGGEMGRILGKLKEAGAEGDALTFIQAEMQKPLDLDALVAEAKTPEQAVEVYAASLLAIEVDTPAEEEYLRRLADGLGLDAATVTEVHAAVGVGKPA